MSFGRHVRNVPHTAKNLNGLVRNKSGRFTGSQFCHGSFLIRRKKTSLISWWLKRLFKQFTLVKGLCSSWRAAARHVRRRALSSWRAMSAILFWIDCSFVMGLPNATLFPAYSTAQSNAAWPIPSAWEAMPIRPASSVVMAILKPEPGWPSKFSFGTWQSSKMTLQVDEPRIPSLS